MDLQIVKFREDGQSIEFYEVQTNGIISVFVIFSTFLLKFFQILSFIIFDSY